jgi:hypothetical protein
MVANEAGGESGGGSRGGYVSRFWGFFGFLAMPACIIIRSLISVIVFTNVQFCSSDADQTCQGERRELSSRRADDRRTIVLNRSGASLICGWQEELEVELYC